MELKVAKIILHETVDRLNPGINGVAHMLYCEKDHTTQQWRVEWNVPAAFVVNGAVWTTDLVVRKELEDALEVAGMALVLAMPEHSTDSFI